MTALTAYGSGRTPFCPFATCNWWLTSLKQSFLLWIIKGLTCYFVLLSSIPFVLLTVKVVGVVVFVFVVFFLLLLLEGWGGGSGLVWFVSLFCELCLDNSFQFYVSISSVQYCITKANIQYESAEGHSLCCCLKLCYISKLPWCHKD